MAIIRVRRGATRARYLHIVRTVIRRLSSRPIRAIWWCHQGWTTTKSELEFLRSSDFSLKYCGFELITDVKNVGGFFLSLRRICGDTNSYVLSQASSLAEDCVDSYVPVQCGIQSTTEEYMDMDPRNKQRAQLPSNLSSAASSSSITSGTPSTDIRFAEYQLDKIVSHFTPDDDETK